MIADENSPKKYQIPFQFSENHIPKEKSNRFSYPKCEYIKTQENINGFSISLCLSELYEYKVFRDDGAKKKEIYDSFTDGKNLTIFDYDIMPNVIYKYSVIPYYISNGKTFYGEEIYSNKVKSSKIIFDDDLLDILYND